MSRYQNKHSPTLTPFVVISHPLSASSIYLIHDILLVQYACLAVFFPRSLSKISLISVGLAPSTSYSIHFFTQSLSSSHNTCPYHRNLFCCSTEIMSSNPSLPLNPLLGILSRSLTAHIHLTILISAHWSATLFSFLMAGKPCEWSVVDIVRMAWWSDISSCVCRWWICGGVCVKSRRTITLSLSFVYKRLKTAPECRLVPALLYVVFHWFVAHFYRVMLR